LNIVENTVPLSEYRVHGESTAEYRASLAFESAVARWHYAVSLSCPPVEAPATVEIDAEIACGVAGFGLNDPSMSRFVGEEAFARPDAGRHTVRIHIDRSEPNMSLIVRNVSDARESTKGVIYGVRVISNPSDDAGFLSKSGAERYGVSGRIHEKDYILSAIRDSPNLADKSQAVAEYFWTGHCNAVFIKDILNSLALPRPMSVLDFASGYGRVARHLVRVLPDDIIVTSDIHAEAVSFNKSIGLNSVLSTTDPDTFDPGRTFDAIVAISFFTHMPHTTWGRWLSALSRYLTPTGKLIFTTHGRAALATTGIDDTFVDERGFKFWHVSDQVDLEMRDYGTAVAYFEYVYNAATNAGLRVYRFIEGGLGHTDLVILTPIESHRRRLQLKLTSHT
jgi:SAM-dependent methyltransferase